MAASSRKVAAPRVDVFFGKDSDSDDDELFGDNIEDKPQKKASKFKPSLMSEGASGVDCDDEDDKNRMPVVSNGDDEDDADITTGNACWADAMSRVLKSDIPSAVKVGSVKKRRVGRRKSSVILSRGKTDREVAETRKKKEASAERPDGFEIERVSGTVSELSELDPIRPQESTEIKDEVVAKSHIELVNEMKERRLEKKLWEDMGRVKPDITHRDKERFLQRVATAGVVQLFNAVKLRQATVETKLKKVGASEIKREKVMKSMTKQDFLNILKNAKSIRTPQTSKSTSSTITKIDVDDDGDEKVSKVQPTWEVLRDDYMMGAEMKDWDKASDSADDDEIVPATKSI